MFINRFARLILVLATVLKTVVSSEYLSCLYLPVCNSLAEYVVAFYNAVELYLQYFNMIIIHIPQK